MKRILIFSTLALLAIACHKEPYSQDSDGEYLVYTSPSKDVNFANYQTFDVVDSVLVIGQKPKPFYSQSDNAHTGGLTIRDTGLQVTGAIGADGTILIL